MILYTEKKEEEREREKKERSNRGHAQYHLRQIIIIMKDMNKYKSISDCKYNIP